MSRSSQWTTALLLSAFLLVAQPAMAAPKTPVEDVFDVLANEVATKVLDAPAFQARTEGGRKVKIVIGDVMNNTDQEGIRVEDIFATIRNQIVSAGAARLFAPGELNVDFVIAPELTSSMIANPRGRGRSQRCFTLNLTLTKPSGEFVLAQQAKRCS
jgi:hypothetical protein